MANKVRVHTQIGVVSIGSRGGKGNDVEDATNSFKKRQEKYWNCEVDKQELEMTEKNS